MYLLMWALAFVTHLPRYRDLSPSRSATASCSPVEAPDGTAARPTLPSARNTSASTVGLPRESRISRPAIFTILVIGSCQIKKSSSPECARYLILLRGYDHDTGLGYGIAGGAVGIGVKSDGAGFGDLSSGVYNGAADAAVAADFQSGRPDPIIHFYLA